MAQVIPQFILDQFKELERYDIKTPLRLAHFLSQCHHESVGFNVKVENLNYSAAGLVSVFPKYFPDMATAQRYERQPQRIADKVYADRLGNGNEASGDGYKYRGRGYIQLTGRDNYIALGKFLQVGLLSEPDLVSEQYALVSAAWFWHVNDLNAIADRGATKETVISVTKKINGGTNGLAERLKHFESYYAELNK